MLSVCNSGLKLSPISLKHVLNSEHPIPRVFGIYKRRSDIKGVDVTESSVYVHLQ